jgi:hypothetical protein
MRNRSNESKKSAKGGQKVRIFFQEIRNLNSTMGIRLAKDFAREYLTPDQARAIFPGIDFSDVDFAHGH